MLNLLYYLDVGKAVMSCWSDKIVERTPCGSLPAFPPDGAGPDWECLRVDTSKGAKKDDSNPCTMYGVPEGTISCPPGKDQDRDADLRSAGLNPQDLLKWRWLCASTHRDDAITPA